MLEAGADLERWRKAADEALYAAKAAGRNQVVAASRRAQPAGLHGFWPPLEAGRLRRQAPAS